MFFSIKRYKVVSIHVPIFHAIASINSIFVSSLLNTAIFLAD